jgi:hypothetical protein
MFAKKTTPGPKNPNAVATLSYGVKNGERLQFTKIAELEAGQGKAQYKADFAGLSIPAGARLFIFPEGNNNVTKGAGRDVAANLTLGVPNGDKTAYTKITGLFHAQGKAQYSASVKEAIDIGSGTLFVFPESK